MRRVLGVVRRQVAEQLAGKLDGMAVVAGDQMHVAADGGVHGGAADIVHRGLAPGDRLDDLGPGDEHAGIGLGHDDEVHQRRRIGRAAGAGSGDDRDLRHDPRQQHVVVEDAAIAGQRVDPFLDPGPAGVLEGDQRDAELAWRGA